MVADPSKLTTSICRVPPNCRFEIDDVEKDWTWSRPFDFIFSRMMTGSFANMPTMVGKVFEYVVNIHLLSLPRCPFGLAHHS